MTCEPERVSWTPFNRAREDGALRPWPKVPRAPAWIPRRVAVRDPNLISPHNPGPRTALEVLSRLAGGTTFRMPSVGRATDSRGSGIDDLAHAVGFIRDPLDQRLTMAVACGSVAEWSEIQRLAFPRLLGDLLAAHNMRAVVAGAKRYRVRLVLHDAFFDVALNRIRDTHASALRIHMTAREYRAMYKVAAGFVETRAQAGAHVAVMALFGG